MRKLILLLLIPWILAAQTTKTGRIMTGTLATRPAACSPGDQFNTTDGNGAYLCNPTTNTWQAFAGTNQALLPNVIVPFSATPSFNTTLNQMFSITLTGNVTSSTASGSPVNGSVMKLHICQGAGGPWTFAFPANFLNITTIQTTGCSDQTYTFDGTNWSQVTQPAGAGGGGGSPPGGANNDPQCNNATTSFKACAINSSILYISTGGNDAATGLSWDTAKQTIAGACAALPGGNSGCTTGSGTLWTTSPSIVLPAGATPNITLHILGKFGDATSGPDPGMNVLTFGVRPMVQSAAPVTTGITASITTGTNTATISSNTCASQPGGVCFVSGDGVVIYGAGATCTLSTPLAPTVTPTTDASLIGTGDVVNGPTGSTTYQYQVVAVDKNGCVTPASPATSISTGQASLGQQSVNITSCSRSGNVATCLTAAPHGLAVGTAVTIYQTSDDTNFGGPQLVATVPDNTHFTFINGIDLRNGNTILSDLTGVPVVGNSSGNGTSATGGTAQWFNENKISVTSVSGAWEYCLYGRTSGAMAWINCGRPQGDGATSTITDLNLYDYGSTLEGNRLRPAWQPSTPPVSIQNDWLATTSTISGLTLTLATNASNTVSGAIIRHDNFPNIINAANEATQIGHGGGANYLLYFPITPNGLFYDTASYMKVPQNLHLAFAGQAYLNGTFELQSGDELTGNVNRAGWPAGGFGQSSGADIFVNEAYPGFYGGNFRYNWDHLTITSSVQNGVVDLVFDQVQPLTMRDTNVISSTSANGGLDIPIILRGQGGTSSGGGTSSYVLDFQDDYFAGGGQSFWPSFTTNAPAFFCNGCGFSRFRNIQLNQRTFATAGGNIEIDGGRIQGGMNPFLSVVACGSFGCNGNGFIIKNYEFDTYYGTVYTDFTSGPNSFRIDGYATGCISGGEPSLSGSPAKQIYWGSLCNPIGQNHDISFPQDDYSQTDPFGNGQLYGARRELSNVHFPANQKIYFDLPQMAAPAATAVAGGSMAIANYTFYVIPIGFDGGTGVRSLPSNTCTPSGGNLSCQITWVGIAGVTGYYLAAQSGGGGACRNAQVGANVTTFTYTTTPANAFGCFIGTSGSGLTYAKQGEVGSPQFRMTGGSAGFSGLQNSATLTANRTYTWPDVTGTVVVSASGNITPGAPQFSVQTNGGSGNFVGVGPSTAPNNVAKNLTFTAVGGVGTALQQALQGVVPRTTVCPSNIDTVLPTDRANEVKWNDSSACAVTLPQAGSGGGGNLDFTSNFFFKGCNIGAGTVTITPTASLINGAGALILVTNQCALITEDNTNWFADKVLNIVDYPERFYVPAANCNNTTAGAGWSIGASGSVTCRAGTNNKSGYVSITDTSTTFAQFTLTLPLDWDTTVNPFIRFYVASTDTTSGHTIIPEFQVSCSKGDGSTTDDVAFNALHSSSTITLNTTANQFWSNSNVQMNSTDMTGCVAGALMTVLVGRATDTATNANFYGAGITFPRVLTLGAE